MPKYTKNIAEHVTAGVRDRREPRDSGRDTGQGPMKFYSGKTSLMVPSGAGGGYDAYGPLGRHLANHVPVKPQIVIENMPGASGAIGTNWLYNVAPHDGPPSARPTTRACHRAAAGQYRGQIRFPPSSGQWIGSMNTQYNACRVWHTSSIMTIEDAMKREVRVSTTGLSGDSAKTPHDAEHADRHQVQSHRGLLRRPGCGWRSSGAKSKVSAGCPMTPFAAANPEWVINNKMRFIMQTGSKPEKALPDVPLLINYVKGQKEKRGARKSWMSRKKSAGRTCSLPAFRTIW